jgi:hypothetical protein
MFIISVGLHTKFHTRRYNEYILNVTIACHVIFLTIVRYINCTKEEAYNYAGTWPSTVTATSLGYYITPQQISFYVAPYNYNKA